jgi:LPS-assembly protein
MRAGRFAAAICLLLLAAAPAAMAQSLPKGAQTTPILITADEVNYDRDRSLVIAKGNVEISQGGRVLRANRVIYNQKTRTVTAVGKVSLTEPGGHVVFADRVVLKDDLRDGVVRNFRMLFPDETRVAANSAVRSEGKKTTMNKVVFSPCKLCPTNPERPPLWQLKARRVVHNQETHDIEYFDGWLEIFGLPVVYSPYFRHPDPTVKRRTGFLRPVYGSDQQLGAFIRVPYFIVLGPDKDLTVTPTFFTKVRPSLGLDWRHRVPNGAYDIRSSVTYVKRLDNAGNEINGNVTRGHFFTRGLFDIDSIWRFGWDGGWTTDDTYLRRYDITSIDNITSTAFLEGFNGRSYASARFYHFQGLRITDVYDQTPIVAPLVDYSVIGKPLGPSGEYGRWSFDANVMSLQRIDGPNSRRLSLTGGWEVPFTTEMGFLIRVGANVQGDLYWVQAVPDPDAPPPGNKFYGVTGRLFPQGYVDWRYPLVRELGNVRHVLEPRVSFIAAPNYGNPFKIPNEDSLDVELDDTNVFALNRFNGLDRVDQGLRVVYGVSSSFYGNRGGKTEIFLGNSYRFTNRHQFPSESGLDERFSDLVGRIDIQPSNFLHVLYRFRLGTQRFRRKRHEITAAAGPPWLRLGLSYFYFQGNENNAEFGEREEILGTLFARLNKNWALRGVSRYDIENDKPVEYSLGAVFRNECCTVDFSYTRSFTTDRDVKASNRFLLRIIFKHLGEIEGGL